MSLTKQLVFSDKDQVTLDIVREYIARIQEDIRKRDLKPSEWQYVSYLLPFYKAQPIQREDKVYLNNSATVFTVTNREGDLLKLDNVLKSNDGVAGVHVNHCRKVPLTHAKIDRLVALGCLDQQPSDGNGPSIRLLDHYTVDWSDKSFPRILKDRQENRDPIHQTFAECRQQLIDHYEYEALHAKDQLKKFNTLSQSAVDSE